jgi:hypothetical protein
MAFSPHMLNDVLSVFNLLKIDTESRGVITRSDAVHILVELGEEDTDLVVKEIFTQHHQSSNNNATISWIDFVKSISHVYKLKRVCSYTPILTICSCSRCLSLGNGLTFTTKIRTVYWKEKSLQN